MSTTTEDLIDDEARAMIGVVQYAEGEVSRREFQRWAAAVDDLNPLYFDAGVARANGYRDVVMPPLFLPFVTRDVILLESLGPDGLRVDPGGGLVQLAKCPRLMGGGDAFEFADVLYHGDRIETQRSLVSLEQKHGRSGDFVLATSRIEAWRTGADAAPVGVITTKVLAFPA